MTEWTWTEWTWLEDPTAACDTDFEGFLPDLDRDTQAVQLLDNDGDCITLGDWHRNRLTSDEGCMACCNESRKEVIVAWRVIEVPK